MTDMAAPVIHAAGLTKRFGELEAVKGIDLDVQPGEIFGFLGPNGAGKSTTINMPDRVRGRDARHGGPQL